MTRAAEIAYVAAVLCMGSVVWQAWHGRPITAIAYAINGTTFALMSLTLVMANRNRP
jgi:hypothetical protein